MRFLVFMIPAVYQPKAGKQQPGPDFMPDPVMMEKMGKFNDELRKAGALLSVDGLQPLSAGARLAFDGGKVSLTDGPAIEAREVVGGYWLVEAKTKQQVVDWWKRCPAQAGDVIEIREVAGSKEQGTGSKEQGAGSRAPQGAGSKERGTRAPQGVSQTPGPWRKRKGGPTKEQD
jgi:hypothetical protein